MSYNTGQLSGANASDIWDSFVGLLDGWLQAEGYALTKVYTEGGSWTVRQYLFPGETDRFLLIGTYINGYFYVSIAGDYDGNTTYSKLMSLSGTNSETLTADGHMTTTGGMTTRSRSLSVALTALTYWVSVTPSRLILGFRYGSSDAAYYAGKYEVSPGAPVDDPYVLGNLDATPMTTTVTQSFSFMQEPGVAAPVTKAVAAAGFPVAPRLWGSELDGYAGKYVLGKIALTSSTGFRGYLYDCLAEGLLRPTGATNGDTMVLDGKTYVRISTPAESVFVDTTV